MSDSRWRSHAAPIIARVLAEAKAQGRDEGWIRRGLFDAYPFGERRYHPYKVWLDEVRRQRGLKPTKARRGTPKRAQQGAEEQTLDLFAPGGEP